MAAPQPKGPADGTTSRQQPTTVQLDLLLFNDEACCVCFAQSSSSVRLNSTFADRMAGACFNQHAGR